jgi:hypothetical protein
MTHDTHSEKELAGLTPPATDNKEADGKPKKTAGQHIHNEITYRGVDFLLNSTLGVAMTYWTARTESGKKIFQEPVKRGFTKLLTPLLKSPEKIAQGAKRGSEFLSIIIGGMLIIPPMVTLEKKDNKIAIVKWFDELIYGKDRVANDPKFQECFDSIQEEPKKDFWTGMAARFAVLVPMIAATVNPDADKHLRRFLYNPITKISKGAAETIGIKPKALMERGVMEYASGDITKPASFVSDWDFIHRTIGFDFGLTAIYAFAHEFTYKTFAAIKHGWGKEEQHAESPTIKSEQPDKIQTDLALVENKLDARWSEKVAPKGNTYTHLAQQQSNELQMERA